MKKKKFSNFKNIMNNKSKEKKYNINYNQTNYIVSFL